MPVYLSRSGYYYTAGDEPGQRRPGTLVEVMPLTSSNKGSEGAPAPLVSAFGAADLTLGTLVEVQTLDVTPESGAQVGTAEAVTATSGLVSQNPSAGAVSWSGEDLPAEQAANLQQTLQETPPAPATEPTLTEPGPNGGYYYQVGDSLYFVDAEGNTTYLGEGII